MTIRISRRGFLQGAALFSALGFAPKFLTQLAEGAPAPIEGFKDDRILVVLQLGGGNDGLNTVVPHGHDEYYRARPRLGLKGDQLIKINDELALNAKMADLKNLYDNGKVAIVNGVGYPNPDRSHFRSMEIWQTASGSGEYYGDGWLGRYFDSCCPPTVRPQVGVAIGPDRPQAFSGAKGLGVSFDRPDQFGWLPGKGLDDAAHFAKLNEPTTTANASLDFLRHTTSSAILSSKEVEEAARRSGFRPGGGGPKQGNPLDTVAALIRGGLATRVYYASITGFDTHANQLGQQDNLLGRFAQAVAEFQQQLKTDGTSGRVLTMVFSEFGRRVTENASGGTDHGTAAPIFLIGDRVKAGLHSSMPSLSKLDNGDLIHTVDFRSVYASVLSQWLGVDAAPVVKGSFPALPIVA